MNIEEIEIDNPLYEKALDLRYKLFFEEFKLPKSVTADELEPFSTHIVIMESEQLLAYGRLSPLESTTFRISQIVVPEECRRKGYATILIKELIVIASRLKATTIQLNSQVAVTELYRKIGFQPIGETYKVKLTGIEHVKMVYEICTEQVNQ